LFLKPGNQTCSFAEPVYRVAGRNPEVVHANRKQKHINNSGNQYPLPQLMFLNKVVCIKIGLDGYDDFLEQVLDLMVNINVNLESFPLFAG
jgi:hypothetical protein